MLLLLAGLLIKVDYQSASSSSSNQHQPIYQYFAGGIVILIGSLACEACVIAILSEVSSPVAAIGLLNAGLASGYGATLGRAFGNVSVAIAASINGVNHLSLFMYSAYSILMFLLIIVILLVYRRMETLTYAQLYLSESKMRKKSTELHTRSFSAKKT